jgi:competence protein ComEC
LVYTAGVVSLARGQAASRWFGLLALGLAWMVVPRIAVGDGRLHLTVLDVGQGDGLVLRSPSGRVRLVDAGGTYDSRFDIGEAVVGPYLWSLGVARLDGIVVTHAHPDHTGGVGAIVRGFQVGDVWEGLGPRQDRTYDQLDEVLTTARINRRSVARGMGEVWDGVGLRVLGPVPAGQRPWRTRNDDSVVLEIVYGDVRLLLTGDVEAGGEARLKTGKVHIAKVPHHGSRSSSSPEFVERIEPRLALVSAGFRNRFGHPHPTVVSRYRRHGRVLSTAEEGALSISTDGRRIWVSTYEGVHEERLR